MLDDLARRLKAALPGTVPVLPPEEFLVPAEWEQEDATGTLVLNGERGLHVYLRQKAPGGYVQLHDLQPVGTTSGVFDEHWATIDTIAPTEQAASALARLVRQAIGGTPRTGGPIRLIVPPRTERHGTSVRITQQFSVRSAHPR
ncbi:hypothetical protein GCM10008937_15290 [Deinococcus depolymerans]|uniref:DUF3168 domain-containing protein n=2 Tax=Deinococcus depolymerans TaxID=392408 RepID=A0ABN1BZE2_9DEIO